MHRSSPINICPSSVNMSPNALEKDAGLKITELMCVKWDQLWVSTYFVYKDYISGHPSELIPGREDGVNIDIVVLMLNSHFFIGLLSFMYYTVTGVWIHHNFLMRDNKLNQSVNQWRFYSAVTSSPSNNICCCHGDPLQNCLRVWIKPTHCKVKSLMRLVCFSCNMNRVIFLPQYCLCLQALVYKKTTWIYNCNM